MKKILWIFLFFFIVGCSSKKIMVENPISILYNGDSLMEQDYESITKLINQINFSCGKVQNYEGNKLTITTEKQIYQFHISSNYYMGFQENDKYCYTKDSKKVEALVINLNNIITKYTDITYFTIKKENEYKSTNADSIIKLDKSHDYIIINSMYPIYEFKINEIQFNETDDTFTEIDLLYSTDLLEANQNIIIRKEVLYNPNFKISFKSPYGYLINILPKNIENKGVFFITEVKK